MPRPSFFIVGQIKSGTTALYEMLRPHPQIFMPDLKEPEYFAPDLRQRFLSPSKGPVPETLEEYLRLFQDARSDQRCGEASALYMSSRVAAKEIAEFDQEARIIAIVREPASLLRSVHLQAIRDHNEVERSLRRALALEGERRAGKRIPRSCFRPQQLLYSDHVRYVEQLQRFKDVLPDTQVMVVVYDDFLADNEATVRGILEFLGVDETICIAPSEANPSILVRSHSVQNALHRLSVGRGAPSQTLKRVIKATTPERMRRRALRRAYAAVETAPPAPDEELMRELRIQYKPEVVTLGEYLDRDLVELWGYRDL